MTTYHEALAFHIEQKRTGEILDFEACPQDGTISVLTDQGWHVAFDEEFEERGVDPHFYL